MNKLQISFLSTCNIKRLLIEAIVYHIEFLLQNTLDRNIGQKWIREKSKETETEKEGRTIGKGGLFKLNICHFHVERIDVGNFPVEAAALFVQLTKG